MASSTIMQAVEVLTPQCATPTSPTLTGRSRGVSDR